jgi:hypothetical protein
MVFCFNFHSFCFNAEAVPKKILDLMNVEKLTRENVASHIFLTSPGIIENELIIFIQESNYTVVIVEI